MAIKNAAVNGAIKGKHKALIWDTELKGFGVRVYPSGAASWVVVKRLGNGGKGSKLVWTVLAPYKQLTYKEARRKAVAKFNEIAEGSDPVEKKRRERIKGLEVYRSGKLADVFKRYFDKHSEDGRYWFELKQRFERQIIPTIGANTLVANITKTELRKLIDDKESETSSGARMTYAALSPFLKWCASQEIIPANPLEGIQSPDSGDARERVLADEELVKIWEAAEHTPYPWGPYFKLLMLTLQRRDEVAGMEWTELADNRQWIIPAARTKNGKEHLVHLSPLAWEVIDSLYVRAGHTFDSRFVLTTTNATHISGYSRAKFILDGTIKDIFGDGLKPWRVHDLRRTGATGMAMLKVQPHIVERVLNHVSGSASAKLGGIDAALVRVYQRFEYSEDRKEALLKWSDHVSAIVAKSDSAASDVSNVVALRSAL